MPRPALKKDVKRTKLIVFKVNEAEEKAINNLAKRAGLPVSKFIRQCMREWATNKQQQRELPPLF
jgi:hypothetical protein